MQNKNIQRILGVFPNHWEMKMEAWTDDCDRIRVIWNTTDGIVIISDNPYEDMAEVKLSYPETTFCSMGFYKFMKTFCRPTLNDFNETFRIEPRSTMSSTLNTLRNNYLVLLDKTTGEYERDPENRRQYARFETSEAAIKYGLKELDFNAGGGYFSQDEMMQELHDLYEKIQTRAGRMLAKNLEWNQRDSFENCVADACVEQEEDESEVTPEQFDIIMKCHALRYFTANNMRVKQDVAVTILHRTYDLTSFDDFESFNAYMIDLIDKTGDE